MLDQVISTYVRAYSQGEYAGNSTTAIQVFSVSGKGLLSFCDIGSNSGFRYCQVIVDGIPLTGLNYNVVSVLNAVEVIIPFTSSVVIKTYINTNTSSATVGDSYRFKTYLG